MDPNQAQGQLLNPPELAKQELPLNPQSNNKTSITFSLITIVGLIVVFPLGIILIWVLTKWPKWIKISLTVLPFVILGVILAIVGMTVYTNLQENAKNPGSRVNYPKDNQPIATTSATLDTTNWTKYENKNQHFSIKYPEDKIEQYTATPSGIVAFYNKSGQLAKESQYDVTFTSSNMSISYQKQLLDPNLENDVRKRFSESVQLTQFSLNGRQVIKVKPDQLSVPDTGYVTETFEYIQSKNGYLFDVGMRVKTTDKESQEIFDTMVTTLEEQ